MSEADERSQLTELLVSRTVKITDDDICEALSLKCASCYPALAVCNALAGVAGESTAWTITHEHTILQLVAEAERRGLDLSSILTTVDHEPLPSSMRYRRARGLVSDAEFSQWRRDLRDGKI